MDASVQLAQLSEQASHAGVAKSMLSQKAFGHWFEHVPSLRTANPDLHSAHLPLFLHLMQSGTVQFTQSFEFRPGDVPAGHSSTHTALAPLSSVKTCL